MIHYLGRQIPDDEDTLTELIRREAHREVQDDRRDGRPPGALDWVSGLAVAHPEMLPRIEAAYGRLLAEADPDEVREILAQAVEHPGPSNFERLLMNAIEHDANALKAHDDTTHSDSSLLGAVVRTLSSLTAPPPVTATAADVLASIDSKRDGWPTSLIQALVGDFDTHRDKLQPTLERLASNDEEFDLFVAGMLAVGAPLTTKGFDAVGNVPAELKGKFANSAQGFLKRTEEGRQLMISSGAIKSLPADAQARLLAPRPDPWPEMARRLRVP